MLILSLKNALIYVTEIQHSTENLATCEMKTKVSFLNCLKKRLISSKE